MSGVLHLVRSRMSAATGPLLLGVAVVALASCSSNGRSVQTTIPTVTTIVRKVLPPVDVTLMIPGDHVDIGPPFHVTLTFAAHQGARAVRASVWGSGVVTVIDPAEVRSSDPTGLRQMTIDAIVRIDGVGAGEIRGTVDVVNEDEVQSSRIDSVSVLATSSEVLTGRAGVLQLRLDHLEHERAQGLVSETDYLRQRDEILGGGSTTGP